MAERKAPNKLMILVVVGVIVLFVLVVVSKKKPSYSKVNVVPSYDKNSKPDDGDTQADTIRALQAYAKEAVGQAQALNKDTRQQQTTVLENRNKVSKLEKANDALAKATDETSRYNQALEQQLNALKSQLSKVEEAQQQSTTTVDEHGIPIGFGFDSLQQKRKAEVGQWHNPIDAVPSESNTDRNNRFNRLLTPPGKMPKQKPVKPEPHALKKVEEITPVFTIPKDSVLYDAVALTALIGRIPVEGTTPDPYPVKILIGKENLAANGHDLPEIKGMIFSGLGIGDWNLSCVSARLFSATFIFEDGSIVNHTSTNTPLGYISDTKGVQCVSGVFRTNAPRFLRNRVGLAGLGAAGSALASTQFAQQQSGLTGSTTSTFTGNINKLVGGTVIQSATDEVSQWLLDRQKQSFDAVIVNPGAKVSIHIDHTLAIDYSERHRKLRYSHNNTSTSRTLD